MYLNTRLIHDKGYTMPEVCYMQLLKQNRSEDLEKELAIYFQDEFLEKFTEEGIMSTVKKKRKSDSDFSTYRLSKKGDELLKDFQTPEITKGDLDMFDYLCTMYLKNEDEERTIGNKKKTKMYCSIFRARLSLDLYEMYWLCFLFLRDYKFTKKLEYIFFDSNKNRYGTFEGNFEDSPLYQYYDENRENIEKFWEEKEKIRIEKEGNEGK